MRANHPITAARAVLPLIAAIAVLASLATGPAAGAAELRERLPAAGAASPRTASVSASAGACTAGLRPGAAAGAQLRAMHCLINEARLGEGLGPLTPSPVLAASARRKSADLLRCDSFSHFACGRPFNHWIRMAGYLSAPCWRIGENLAWGIGRQGTAASIFRAWMRSESHRAVILGRFEELGLSLRTGSLEGRRGARVWTLHVGAHC